MAVRTTDSGTRDQLAYARLLIKEAQRHGGQGWLDYDRAFRQQAATDPTISWNTLNAGLQASTILGAPPTVHGQGQGMFCTLCRRVDHTRSQCALACLQPTPTSVPPLSRGAATRRRSETLGQARICISGVHVPGWLHLSPHLCHLPDNSTSGTRLPGKRLAGNGPSNLPALSSALILSSTSCL